MGYEFYVDVLRTQRRKEEKCHLEASGKKKSVMKVMVWQTVDDSLGEHNSQWAPWEFSSPNVYEDGAMLSQCAKY